MNVCTIFNELNKVSLSKYIQKKSTWKKMKVIDIQWTKPTVDSFK